MKALFINPDWRALAGQKSGLFNRCWPPLDLLNCAALLAEDGIETEVLDARAKAYPLALLQKAGREADLIFITSSPLDRWQCPNPEVAEFTGFINSLGNQEKTYLLGAQPTLYPAELLEATRAAGVIVGQPEAAVRQIGRGTVQAKIIGPVEVDLNELPLPRYDKIDLNDYYYELLGPRFALLETARGCPFSCSFCLKAMYGDRVRQKGLAQVEREIDYLAAEVKAENIYFIDLEFTLDKPRVRQICEHILRRGYRFNWCCQTRADALDPDLLGLMRRSGCRLVHFGIESGSQRVLDSIDKRATLATIKAGLTMTKKAGLAAAGFFMFGFPGETETEMDQTITFAKELPLDYASFHRLIPYPATKLFKAGPRDGMFPDLNLSLYGRDLVDKKAKQAYCRFYGRLKYLFSSLLEPGLLLKRLKLFYSFIR